MKNLFAVSALLAGSSAMATDGLKMGGFVDGAYKSAGAVSSFFLHDAAFYMGKTMGMGEVMLDLPVAYLAETAGNDFTVGFSKAQAYVNWKYDNGFRWKLGQFDALLGYEAADSADRVFAVAGSVSGMFGSTHTGLVVGYDMSDALGLDLLLANQQDKGFRNAGDNPFDWGFKLTTKSDSFTAAVGGVFNKNAGDNQAMGWTFNVMGETKTEMMTLALDVALKKAAAATGTTVNTAMGFMALADFELAENTTWGLRPEYVKSAETDAKADIKVATGPSFKMSKDFTVRPEYTFSKNMASGSKAHHDFVLSAVHRF